MLTVSGNTKCVMSSNEIEGWSTAGEKTHSVNEGEQYVNRPSCRPVKRK